MFRIRRVHDDVLPVNRAAIERVEALLRERFPAAAPRDTAGLADKLKDPWKVGFRALLLVAERGAAPGKLPGFALLLHDPRLKACWLEWIAADKGHSSRGVGAALYERVREEARALGARGLFLECLPDDPAQTPDPAILAENVARLRFYARYGARPLANQAYQRPVSPDDAGPFPLLVHDGLDGPDAERGPPGPFVQAVVRAVLERKYGHLCPPAYVDAVVAAYAASPQPHRPGAAPNGARTTSERLPQAGGGARRPGATSGRVPAAARAPAERRQPREPILLVVNDLHDIHHVRERGYVEAPVRIDRIQGELERSGLFERKEPREWPDKHITAVHDPGYVGWLKRTCAQTPEGESVYPYVFPIRNQTRPPDDLATRAGYYCIDTFTPVHRNAWPAARRATACALTAAQAVLDGRRAAYALVRPPGHHAERRAFGGFCYLNHAAAAAELLARAGGRVAVLDVDYHHGNGQQEIFWARPDVLTVSLHGHPRLAYPYFSGFEDETGGGEGAGFNLNLPLPEKQDGPQYRRALARALERVAAHRPAALVVCLGLDTAKGDPTGSWTLGPDDLEENGRRIGALGLPTVVVQEGGYRTRTLGRNARAFFQGLAGGLDL